MEMVSIPKHLVDSVVKRRAEIVAHYRNQKYIGPEAWSRCNIELSKAEKAIVDATIEATKQ